MVITIRTPREAVCTASPVDALAHFRKASNSGLRPVAVRIGGKAMCEREMERHVDLVAEAFRRKIKAPYSG